jgi:hypothetical protein
VPILYVETNLIVGVATGRISARGFETLIGAAGPRLRLVIPGTCFFEALAWLEGERKRRDGFARLLAEQITQLERDADSIQARSLASLLIQADAVNRKLFLSIKSRLLGAIGEASRAAELVELEADVLTRSRNAILINESTDNLIAHCLLKHAAGFPSEPKAFLSGNARDFGGGGVRKALKDGGIERFFTEIPDALGWLQSQSRPDTLAGQSPPA